MKLVIGAALCAGGALYCHSLSTSLAEDVTCENVDKKLNEIVVLMNRDIDELAAAQNRNKAALENLDPNEMERAQRAFGQSYLQEKNAAEQYGALQLVYRACLLRKAKEMLRHSLK
jgi:hypothetical protein